ncbi:MAG: D-alanine--D-alanine ligase, partial [Deinococcus sp.]|nr:D-alanine--D-alanine ligase [Deinococcus sp.]
LAGLPFVGSGVLGSAVGMDKIMMKTVFAAHGLPQVPYLPLARSQVKAHWEETLDQIAAALGYPCFVKPANLGSSVGVTKAKNRRDLRAGLEEAMRHDRRLLVEQAVNARELECAVLGNDDPQVSVVGEVVYQSEFYDYHTKYSEGLAELVIPAAIPPALAERIRSIGRQAFLAIDAAGLARADFFLERGSERISLNEINTMPGFTSTSMYPRLWEASGLPYPQLIDRLIELALERAKAAI